MTRKRNIAILATLDTKGSEAASMRDSLRALGYSATLIDIAPLGPPLVQPDIANVEVARAGGEELSTLIRTGERDRVMETMGKGASKLLSLLYFQGKINGVIGLGGNQGTAVASMAMRTLPFGFPKYLISCRKSRLHPRASPEFAVCPAKWFRAWPGLRDFRKTASDNWQAFWLKKFLNCPA